MKENIEKINLLISEKQDRLKAKVVRSFDSIIVPTSTLPSSRSQSTRSSISPVSYILYGIAGISAICAVTTDSKLLCVGITAASAFGGYKLSQNGHSNELQSNSLGTESLSTIKTKISSEVLESVKRTTKEWEDFMELKQKEMQILIDTSSFDDNQKDSMSSKIFVYEIIDISIADFSNMINSASNSADMKQILNTYKNKLLKAIDNAANKQITKYSSLIV